MTADHGDAGVGAQAIEVGAATRARVGDVRQVGVRHVAIRGAAVAVVGAVLRAKALRGDTRRERDDVLRGVVAAGGRVAEVLCGAHGLGRDVGLARTILDGRAAVIPDALENARGIARGGAGPVTELGAAGHALAILGHAVQPGAAADRTQERLQQVRFAARVAAPLRAPENQVDLRRGLHSNTADATAIKQVVGGTATAATAMAVAIGRMSFAHALGFRHGRMNHDRGLALFDITDGSGRAYGDRSRPRCQGHTRQHRQ